MATDRMFGGDTAALHETPKAKWSHAATSQRSGRSDGCPISILGNADFEPRQRGLRGREARE